MGDPAAGDAGRADHLARGVVEPVEPDQQHVGEVVGHPAARPGGGADELLDEERVALGAVDDRRRAPARSGPRATSSAIRARTASSGSGDERDAVDAAQPGPLGDLAAQRVAAVQVVGAVRRHDRHRAGEGPGEQEAEHVAGRLVGPVGVLDDEQQRRLGRRPPRAARARPRTGRRGRGRRSSSRAVAGPSPGARAGAGPGRGAGRRPRRRSPGRSASSRPSTSENGQVGQRAVAEVEAVAGDDLPALGEGEVAQLGQQPGLADAGVAGEQRRGRLADRRRRGSRGRRTPSSEAISASSASRPTRVRLVCGPHRPVSRVRLSAARAICRGIGGAPGSAHRGPADVSPASPRRTSVAAPAAAGERRRGSGRSRYSISAFSRSRLRLLSYMVGSSAPRSVMTRFVV